MLVGQKTDCAKAPACPAVTQCMSQGVGRHEAFRCFALSHKKPCGEYPAESYLIRELSPEFCAVKNQAIDRTVIVTEFR